MVASQSKPRYDTWGVGFDGFGEGYCRQNGGEAARQHGFPLSRETQEKKEEAVALNDDPDFHRTYQHLGRLLDSVNQYERMYSALGYLTPAEFETRWLQ